VEGTQDVIDNGIGHDAKAVVLEIIGQQCGNLVVSKDAVDCAFSLSIVTHGSNAGLAVQVEGLPKQSMGSPAPLLDAVDPCLIHAQLVVDVQALAILTNLGAIRSVYWGVVMTTLVGLPDR